MQELAGRYRVERTLGKGGMGTVLAAVDLETGKSVALKLMDEAWLGDETLLARFFREAMAAAQVNSVHVTQVLAHGTLPDGRPYIVTELLDGFDLAHYMMRERVPVEEVVDYIRQACRGLEAVHRAGIIHRDLKPANLFLAYDVHGHPTVKVLDFGICKLQDRARGQSLTRASDIMGTPRYMSPEQLASTRDVDARTDVWAIGVILYEILCGKPPFPGNHITELTKAIFGDEPQPLQSFRPDVPAGLVKVIERCLAKSRDHRYATADQVDRALAPFGGNELATMPRLGEDRPPTVRLGEEDEPATRRSDEVDIVAAPPPAPTPRPSAAPAPLSSRRDLVVRATEFKRFGRYLVYRPLASGGMASVYYGVARADDGALTSVAIKQVRSDMTSEERVTMLADEARIVGNIQHPNVVGIYDVIVDKGSVMLAMPLVIGTSLQVLRRAAESRKRPFPPAIASAIIRDVLAGINAAHEARDRFGQPLDIIHRDISPHNVLVDIQGSSLVTDFGVAFARGRLQRSTETGTLKGKVGYLAPEQIHGNPTRATDLYAAGAVYWELLTGESLFDGSEAEMLAAALLGRIDPPSKRVPTLSSALDTVVMRSLAREPEKRYATAAEMADAIGSATPVATPADVAAWLKETCAPELADQRAIIDGMLRAVAQQNPFDEPGFATEPTDYVTGERPVVVANTTAPTASSSRKWAIPAVFAGLLAGGAAYALGTHRAEPVTVPAPTSAAPPVASASSEPVPSNPDFEVVTAPSEAQPHTGVAKHPKPRPAPKPTGPKKDCSPPYTIDSSGRQIWKRECF